VARAVQNHVSNDAAIADVETKERMVMNEKSKNESIETQKPERARLTVEVPTQITAGLAPKQPVKDSVSCYCSKSYCCS
jgi:hypothetical protein